MPTIPVAAPPTAALSSDSAADRHARLSRVSHWLYLISANLSAQTVDQIAASTHNLVVLDFIPSEVNNTAYPMASVVARLHQAPHSKLAIAYIDIGQAENYRTYWRPDWQVGTPDWIAGSDPDGWAGNYPVAFWRDEWRHIWLSNQGLLQQILDAGFDGVYLDWVEAYSNPNVVTVARKDGVDPEQEIVRWVGDIAAFGRTQKPSFIVIGQNATDLVQNDAYLKIIDAISQEQIWFDGASDNNPPGDCPLPRTDAEVGSAAYLRQLSPACRNQYDRYPDSTLHVSSETYLGLLTMARDKGKIIFTVDYALQPDNVAWVYQTSRALGFVPYVSERRLGIYLAPVP